MIQAPFIPLLFKEKTTCKHVAGSVRYPKPKEIIQFVVSRSHPGFESPTISHVPHLAPGKVTSTLLTKLRGNRNPGGPGCKKHEASTWVKNHVTSVKLIQVKLSKHSRTFKNNWSILSDMCKLNPGLTNSSIRSPSYTSSSSFGRPCDLGKNVIQLGNFREYLALPKTVKRICFHDAPSSWRPVQVDVSQFKPSNHQ